ncbi:spore wall synthesis complex protein [soil metagenome]
MPLSEHEQRLLDEMERSLYHNDADFVATVGSGRGRPTYRSIVIGVLVGLVGVAVIVAGVMLQLAIVGVAGFVVMFVGVLLAISSPKRIVEEAPRPTESRSKATFMDRMNERWDKRQDGREQ